MPDPLENPRHERFAQALAGGMSADGAYQAAGYRPHRGSASRLRANANVRRRLAELIAAAAERAEITKADVLRGLLREATLGADAPDAAPSAARVAAWRLLGLELGMFAETRRHSGPEGGPIPTLARVIVVPPRNPPGITVRQPPKEDTA